MANIIRIKRGLKKDIENVELLQGELAVTTDTCELYVGDGDNAVKVNQYEFATDSDIEELFGYVELTEQDVEDINEITGSEEDIQSDMYEDDALALTEAIIGGTV